MGTKRWRNRRKRFLEDDPLNFDTTTTNDDDDEIPPLSSLFGNISLPNLLQVPFPSLESNVSVAICNLETLLPLNDTKMEQSHVLHGYEGLKGAFLATKHLNERNGTIISDVGKLTSCPITFRNSFFDTRYSITRTFLYVDQVTKGTFNPNGNQPSLLVGAYSSPITKAMAFLANHRAIPVISGQATSPEMDDTFLYPLFSRTVPTLDSSVSSFLRYCVDKLNLSYLVVVREANTFGSAYSKSFRILGQELTPQIKMVFVSPIESDGNNIPNVIEEIRETKIEFVFGALSTRSLYDDLLLQAYANGLAGTGRHNWMFTSSFRSVLDGRVFERGSPLHLSYRGTGLINMAGGKRSSTKFRKFQNALSELFTNYSIDIGDIDTGDMEDSIDFIEELDHLPESDVLTYDAAAFLYDTVVLAGLAACNSTSSSDLYLNATTFHTSMIQTSFNGVTGLVRLDNRTGSRIPNTTSYSIINYVDSELDLAGGTNRNHTSRLVAFDPRITARFNLTASDRWTELIPYIYNDGTSVPPEGIAPQAPDTNYVSSGIRAYALVLVVLALLTNIGFGAWVIWNRKTRVIAASQPIFILFVVLGCIVLSSTIIPLVIDHAIASIDACSSACTATIWLAAIGLGLIYSTLFAKTYRVNRIMGSAKKFQKVKITVRQTILPVAIVLVVNILILSIMTGMSPIKYTIYILQKDSFGRSLYSYGRCDYTGSLPYVIPLAILNFGMLVLALIQAWTARNLSTELQESKYIFWSLLTSIVSAALGVPVLILAKENPDATAFIATTVVFIICVNIDLFIFVPKVMYHYQMKKHNKDSNVRVTGIDVAPATIESPTQPGIAQVEEAGASGSKRMSGGEIILTSKSPVELIEEQHALLDVLSDRQKTIDEQAEEIARLHQIEEEHKSDIERLKALIERNGLSCDAI